MSGIVLFLSLRSYVRDCGAVWPSPVLVGVLVVVASVGTSWIVAVAAVAVVLVVPLLMMVGVLMLLLLLIAYSSSQEYCDG